MAGSACKDRDLFTLLKGVFGSNSSLWDKRINDVTAECAKLSDTHTSTLPDVDGMLQNWNLDPLHHDLHDSQYGAILYAYVTPIVIITGLLGNVVSFRVFVSKNMRKLSASLYLAAISVSDSLVLLTYVFLGWLDRGLEHLPGKHSINIIHVHGACQTFLYFSYLFRFMSVWILVFFTVERYIAACKPLHRRIICTKTFGRRALIGISTVGALLSLFKPLLSGLFRPTRSSSGFGFFSVPENATRYSMDDPYQALDSTEQICTRNPEYVRLNFIMELTYGLLITAVPFVVLAVFNLMILRTILQRDASIRKCKLAFFNNRIRWEFTITLLAVSSTFICLNLPYFVCWCQQFVQSLNAEDPAEAHRIRNVLYVTKTVFNVNYCINFFLYCLTGTYYRRQLTMICRPGSHETQPLYLPRKSSSSFVTLSTRI